MEDWEEDVKEELKPDLLDEGSDYDEDDDFDEEKHSQLLKAFKNLDDDKKNVKKNRSTLLRPAPKNSAVDLNDLIGTIKSTRNLNEVNKKLGASEKTKTTEKREVINGDKIPEDSKKSEKAKKVKVLDVPLHSRASNRIESGIAYKKAKKELDQWSRVVNDFRVAEQISYPLNDDNTVRIETAEEKASSFRPRTELEKQMAEVLAQSKYNLTNEDEFCEAEKELLKAMDVEEAKRKCNELRKMRSLMSYKAAKQRREAKIKSKQYHKIKKRQRRKELLKEFEEMIVQNPEKAKEKMDELQKDTAFERATLKHRGVSKWNRAMRQFASRNPELKKLLEEHLRFGRELKAKRGLEVSDDDEESAEGEQKPLSTEEIVNLAVEQANTSKQTITIEALKDNPFLRGAVENLKRERKEAQKQALKRGSKEDDQEHKELSFDNFINLNTRQITNIVPQTMFGKEEGDEDFHRNFLAAAYEDDDCFEEFKRDKEAIEESEKPKNETVSMAGWGSWTGPGIKEKEKIKIVKRAKPIKRKDAKRKGVIIRETVSQGVIDLQPRDIPFPFTSIKDYETFIQQPLGPEWNTPIAHESLIQPEVVTKAGRIIRPVEKSEKMKYRMRNEEDFLF